MKKVRFRHATLLNRIILFLAAFGATLVLQLGISHYQTAYVLDPLAERTRDIQSISQFLANVEECTVTLEDYRWDYGDTDGLITSLQNFQQRAASRLADIKSDLNTTSQEQYLLANAAKTTCKTFFITLERIVELLQDGLYDDAATLYYEKAAPCGDYLRQYTQQLLEQAILDNQSTYIQLSRLNDRLSKLQTVTLIACFCLGTVVVISLLALLKLVMEMSRASQAISRGDLETPDVDETLDDEIGHLARTFNEMKRSMRQQVQLLNEKNEMERALHKRETEALEWQNLMEREKHQQLRSQINPHFLFNTLNVIMYTARQEGAEQTHSLLGSLSKLFRYTLASNEMFVPLSREVHIVNEFYALYHARFAERMKMVWNVSPQVDLTETLVPSFILQPLVENGFKHGLGPKEEGGTVEIRIWAEESTLNIHVSDDGVGIPEDVLRQVQENLGNPPQSGEHIGVYNVASRLRLCGEGFGMTILSREGQGTTTAMWMPLQTLHEGEEETDDQDSDS